MVGHVIWRFLSFQRQYLSIAPNAVSGTEFTENGPLMDDVAARKVPWRFGCWRPRVRSQLTPWGYRSERTKRLTASVDSALLRH